MSNLRMPAALAAALSVGLNFAIIGTAGRTLNVWQTQRFDNPFFLPIWTSHFDMRGLHALIGTSTVIVVSNAALAAALFMPALPANALVLGSSLLSTVMAIVAISFSSVLHNRAPQRDTLQTWTCAWRNMAADEVPRQFDALCHETLVDLELSYVSVSLLVLGIADFVPQRFAFYTTVPSFLLQLLLLAFAVYALLGAGASSKRGMRLDEEKDHELVPRKQHSSDSKSGSLRSTPESVQVTAGKR